MARAIFSWTAKHREKAPGVHLATTAYVEGEGAELLFSVDVTTVSPVGVSLAKATEIEIVALVDSFNAKLCSGAHVIVTEGARVLGTCVVL